MKLTDMFKDDLIIND